MAPPHRDCSVPEFGRCRSCGATMRWVRSELGRPMPLDMEPSDRGNVQIIPTPRGEVGRVLVPLELEQRRGVVELYLVHHASCPDRERWTR